MTSEAPPPATAPTLQDRLEQWIYRLNEQEHWLFRLYDLGNEIWARIFFRGVRKRASRICIEVEVRDERPLVRFLTLDDIDAFAELLSAFDVRYLPPHPLDRAAAERALRRASYIPIGIFLDGKLMGYILLRLFFPRRAVTGIWMLASTHSGGIGRHTLVESVRFLESEGLPNFCTIPIGNDPSVKIALWCGWRILRTNERFHVLKVQSDCIP